MVGDILEFTQGPQQNLLVGPMDYAMYIGQLVQELEPEAALKSSTLELANEPWAGRTQSLETGEPTRLLALRALVARDVAVAVGSAPGADADRFAGE